MASGVLRDLVELLGYAPTIELLRAWGGRRVKVPATMPSDHALVYIVGWDAAQKLARGYGGADPLDLPAERNHLVDLRNAALVAKFQRGATITQLHQDFGLSRRQVNSVLDALGHRDERLRRAAAVGTRT